MNFVKKFWKEWKWAILASVAILVLGLALRLYRVTLLPVFADEAIYIRWAQVMGAEPTLRFLPLSDGKQPLFMWILMFYVRRLSDPLFAGRILSVFSGLGTTIGIFAVSHLLFKNKLVSLISSLIWAISPFSFLFDRMALVDSMLAMFSVWTMFFALLTSKTKRLDMAMITGFFLGGALLTKSPAIFILLLIPTTWIFVKRWGGVFKLLLLLVVTYLIGYGMYNILRLGPNFHLISSRNADYVLPISHLWTNFKDPFIFHVQEVFKDWFIKMGPWPILILGVFGLTTSFKKYWKEKLLLLSWFLFPILVQSEYAKVFTVRYILYTLPFFFILAASSFLETRKAIRTIAITALVLFIGTSFIFDFYLLTDPAKAKLPNSERSGYLEEWTAGDGIKEIADFLRYQSLTINHQRIVVGTEGFFGTLPDGLQMYLNDVPQITVIGTGLDFKEIPQSLMESKKFGNKTYLVVNKSRFLGNPDKLGLELVAAYPKALRINEKSREFKLKGPQEVLYFYEVTQKAI
jgi:4-amino-4-deoxy-L-arabinose transferase-like glycosyltransferase